MCLVGGGEVLGMVVQDGVADTNNEVSVLIGAGPAVERRGLGELEQLLVLLEKLEAAASVGRLPQLGHLRLAFRAKGTHVARLTIHRVLIELVQHRLEESSRRHDGGQDIRPVFDRGARLSSMGGLDLTGERRLMLRRPHEIGGEVGTHHEADRLHGVLFDRPSLQNVGGARVRRSRRRPRRASRS
jgi:hypothetical protein